MGTADKPLKFLVDRAFQAKWGQNKILLYFLNFYISYIIEAYGWGDPSKQFLANFAYKWQNYGLVCMPSLMKISYWKPKSESNLMKSHIYVDKFMAFGVKLISIVNKNQSIFSRFLKFCHPLIPFIMLSYQGNLKHFRKQDLTQPSRVSGSEGGLSKNRFSWKSQCRPPLAQNLGL